MEKIVLFDGDCAFCNEAVHFIIKRDKYARFYFAPLNSSLGVKLRRRHKVINEHSLLFIENNKIHTKSSAVLHINKYLHGLWKVFFLFTIIPKRLRDWMYQYVANRRLKWFGKQKVCRIYPTHIQKRFLT